MTIPEPAARTGHDRATLMLLGAGWAALWWVLASLFAPPGHPSQN